MSESLAVTESGDYIMRTNRRKFIGSALAGGLAATWSRSCSGSEARRVDYARLDEILKKPVLKKGLFARPVIIKSLELLRYKNSFLCRVRSRYFGWSQRDELSLSNFSQLVETFFY